MRILMGLLLATAMMVGCVNEGPADEAVEPEAVISDAENTPSQPEPVQDPGRVVVDPAAPVPDKPFVVTFAGEHGRDCDPDWEVQVFERFKNGGTEWDGEYLIAAQAGSWPVSAEFVINREVQTTILVGLSCSPTEWYGTEVDVLESNGLDSEDDEERCKDFDYDGVCDDMDVCPHDPNDRCAGQQDTLQCEDPDHPDTAIWSEPYAQPSSLIYGCITQSEDNSGCTNPTVARTASTGCPGNNQRGAAPCPGIYCDANTDTDWLIVEVGANWYEVTVDYDHAAGDIDMYWQTCGHSTSATGTETTMVVYAPYESTGELVVIGYSTSDDSWTNDYEITLTQFTPDKLVLPGQVC